MSYTLRLVTAPAIEPVSLAEAKAQVRQAGDADDALLTRLIKVAREYFEQATGRALITQTWEATFGEWPRVASLAADDMPSGLSQFDDGMNFAPVERLLPHLEIHKLPFGALSSITAAGSAWTAYTAVRTTRGIRIKPTGAAPDGEIVVTFTAGFGDTAALVPSSISHAILMLVATLYDNPGAMALDTTAMKMVSQSVPGFRDVIDRYRIIL